MDRDFKSTIQEMKACAEHRRQRAMYNYNLGCSVNRIKEVISDEQLKTWKLVDALIEAEAAKSPPIEKDEIQKKLRSEEQ